MMPPPLSGAAAFRVLIRLALVVEFAGRRVVLIFATTFHPHAAGLIAWAGVSDVCTREVDSKVLGFDCEFEEIRTEDCTAWADDGGESDVLHGLFSLLRFRVPLGRLSW